MIYRHHHRPMCQQCINWLNNPLVPPPIFHQQFQFLSEALPRATRPPQMQPPCFFPDRALISTVSACLLTPTCVLAWNQCTCRRVHVTVARERTVPFAREHSHRAFPFSRWFTARTCLGRCRSHNGESCRRRSPPDTVITGWHLPGRDHNDNGRFAGKTSSYTPALRTPRRDHLCPDRWERSQLGLGFTVVYRPARVCT